VSVLSWARFFAEVLPDLSALARSLFEAHGGDATRAKTELRVIRDHGERRRQEQSRIDAELARARAKKEP
jgi:hypothetical protein